MTAETALICVFTADTSSRARRRCPYHKRLCYGTLRTYYDTVRMSFDCETFVDYGYGEWRPPPHVQRAKWRVAKRRQRAKV